MNVPVLIVSALTVLSLGVFVWGFPIYKSMIINTPEQLKLLGRFMFGIVSISWLFVIFALVMAWSRVL